MSLKKSEKIALSAMFAAFVGYIAGILTAPKSGKETRKDIAHNADVSKRELEQKLKSAHVELKKSIKLANAELDTAKKEIKKDLDIAINKAKKVEVKVKETLSAVHEGTADNPELATALKEASAALNHFKKYLSK